MSNKNKILMGTTLIILLGSLLVFYVLKLQKNEQINQGENETSEQIIDEEALRSTYGIVAMITDDAIYIKKDNGQEIKILIDEKTSFGKEEGRELVTSASLRVGLKVMAAVNGRNEASLIVIKSVQ